MRRFLTSLIITVLAFSASPAIAADPSVAGIVRSGTGTAISGVVVNAVQSNNTISSTTTSSDGYYEINVPAGTYTLEFKSPSASYTSLATLPLTLPRNWPLNVVLTTPTVGKIFLTGRITTDDGRAAGTSGNPPTPFFGGGGNKADANGYFKLQALAGASAAWAFSGSSLFPNGSRLGFYISGGQTFTYNQDSYLDVVAPTTTTRIRLVDPSGNPISSTEVGATVRLDVGGAVDNQNGSSRAMPEGTVSLFPGLSNYKVTWQSIGSSDASGVANLSRIKMPVGLQGVATVYFSSNTKWKNIITKVVDIPADGGDITLVATPTSNARVIGTAKFADGTPLAGGYLGTVSGVNTGSFIAADGSYAATLPSGTNLNTFSVWYDNKSTTDNFVLDYFGTLKPTNLYGDFLQNVTVPNPLRQQITVLDPSGAVIPNAAVRLNVQSGDGYSLPTYPLLPGQNELNVAFRSNGNTNSSGVASLQIVQLTAPTYATISASAPAGSGLIPISQKLLVGGGPITIQLQQIWDKGSGTITTSDGFPLYNPRVSPLNQADSAGAFTGSVPDLKEFSWRITPRQQDSFLPDPLIINLGSDPDDVIIPTGEFVQNFVVPMKYQKIKIVDADGTPIANAKLVLTVGGDIETSTIDVTLAPNLLPFSGSWTARAVTSATGWATIPGVAMSLPAEGTLSITPDVNSRYMPRTAKMIAGSDAETVVVLAIKPPVISTLSKSTIKPGETLTILGDYFLGAISVTLDGTSVPFSVIDDKTITIQIPSNANSGSFQIRNGGGTSPLSTAITIDTTPFVISTKTLPDGLQNSIYSQQLISTGGVGTVIWARDAGGLPNGLNISPEGLISGTALQAGSWEFTISARDSLNESRIQKFTISIDPEAGAIPGAVGLTSAVASGSSINVSWMPTLIDNGNPISGHQVQTSINGGQTWVTAIENTNSPALSASFKPIGGKSYLVRVAAINAAGIGPYGMTSDLAIVKIAPEPVSNLVISTSGTKGKATWTAPNSDGGSPIIDYRVRVSTDLIGWTTVIDRSGNNATTATFSLPDADSYYVQVAAINSINISPYLNSSTQIQVLPVVVAEPTPTPTPTLTPTLAKFELLANV